MNGDVAIKSKTFHLVVGGIILIFLQHSSLYLFYAVCGRSNSNSYTDWLSLENLIPAIFLGQPHTPSSLVDCSLFFARHESLFVETFRPLLAAFLSAWFECNFHCKKFMNVMLPLRPKNFDLFFVLLLFFRAEHNHH